MLLVSKVVILPARRKNSIPFLRRRETLTKPSKTTGCPHEVWSANLGTGRKSSSPPLLLNPGQATYAHHHHDHRSLCRFACGSRPVGYDFYNLLKRCRSEQHHVSSSEHWNQRLENLRQVCIHRDRCETLGGVLSDAYCWRRGLLGVRQVFASIQAR